MALTGDVGVGTAATHHDESTGAVLVEDLANNETLGHAAATARVRPDIPTACCGAVRTPRRSCVDAPNP